MCVVHVCAYTVLTACVSIFNHIVAKRSNAHISNTIHFTKGDHVTKKRYIRDVTVAIAERNELQLSVVICVCSISMTQYRGNKR